MTEKQQEQLCKIVIKYMNNSMNEEDLNSALNDFFVRYPDLHEKYNDHNIDGEDGYGYDEEEIFG